MTEEKKPAKAIADWELIERHYRAGLLSLREIAKAVGDAVTEGAIRKRAKKDGWTRDLSVKIQQKAQEKAQREEVRKELVRTGSTQLSPADERTVVDVYAQKVADVDLIGRDDVRVSMDISRSMWRELGALSNPAFFEDLEKLGDLMDESGPNASGNWVKDKLNETYKYIISLAGRIKMAKDAAATHAVYIPLQRKMFGLDAEKQQTSELDAVLRVIAGEASA